MKRLTFLGGMLALFVVALTACGSVHESAVRQGVTDAEGTFEAALRGNAGTAAFEQYYATPQKARLRRDWSRHATAGANC